MDRRAKRSADTIIQSRRQDESPMFAELNSISIALASSYVSVATLSRRVSEWFQFSIH